MDGALSTTEMHENCQWSFPDTSLGIADILYVVMTWV